jgi:hypothetical protein
MSGYDVTVRIDVVETLDGPCADHVFECEHCEDGSIHHGPHHKTPCTECDGSGERVIEGHSCAECQAAEMAWRREHMTARERLLEALLALDAAQDAVEDCPGEEKERMKALREAEQYALNELQDAARAWRDDQKRGGAMEVAHG